ncbi:hypothetical protein ACSBL2_16240 [Pedobacter sp. AW31-3R]|uniref:hypothetical protein n=1 Tax=Pedobacter sp. AW31-3R TaxID=3445781 RepID=UPI003FA15ACB
MKRIVYNILMQAVLVTILTSWVYGQKKKLYFLADTTNTTKHNRYFEISSEGKEIQYYMFYCKCIAPYQKNVIFIYHPYKTKPIFTDELPNYHFNSWMELSNLVSEKGKDFERFYELFIVEPISGNKFMTNPVHLFIKKEEVVE